MFKNLSNILKHIGVLFCNAVISFETFSSDPAPIKCNLSFMIIGSKSFTLPSK